MLRTRIERCKELTGREHGWVWKSRCQDEFVPKWVFGFYIKRIWCFLDPNSKETILKSVWKKKENKIVLFILFYFILFSFFFFFFFFFSKSICFLQCSLHQNWYPKEQKTLTTHFKESKKKKEQYVGRLQIIQNKTNKQDTMREKIAWSKEFLKNE